MRSDTLTETRRRVTRALGISALMAITLGSCVAGIMLEAKQAKLQELDDEWWLVAMTLLPQIEPARVVGSCDAQAEPSPTTVEPSNHTSEGESSATVSTMRTSKQLHPLTLVSYNPLTGAITKEHLTPKGETLHFSRSISGWPRLYFHFQPSDAGECGIAIKQVGTAYLVGGLLVAAVLFTAASILLLLVVVYWQLRYSLLGSSKSRSSKDHGRPH